MARLESSPGGRQYGLPFHGEEILFPITKKVRDGEAYFQVDTKRTEASPKPGSLPKPDLTNHSQLILERKYLLRDERGNVVETPEELFWRVAYNVGTADLFYGEDPSKSREKFYLLMANRYFCPNSPTLMNAGAELQQLSGCFALPIEDSMESILETHNKMTWIHKTGGGTGFNFSNLRPKDTYLSTGGVASGPVSFMEGLFDATTETIKQGGKRRGANMGILETWHPDIREFVTAKLEKERLVNFNLSVGASDKFMRAVKEGKEWDLIDPRIGEVTEKDNAREIFQLIVETAHASGGPGLIFLDRINEANLTPGLGEIETTNPCGEQPLLPYESCNLGSINLALMVEDKEIQWDRLERVVKTAVHFLDNVVDMNEFPDAKIEEATLKTRKIGLGIMGFADMLVALGIKYDSEEAVGVAEEVMQFIKEKSHEASEELAKKRGVFPAYKDSIYYQQDQQGQLMRNAAVTTIAPTGTISLIMGCLSGIEPLFGFTTIRRDSFFPEGKRIINPRFEEMIKELGLSEEAKEKIAKQNSLEGIDEISEDWKRILRTAHDVSPEWHVRIQAAFQKHVDSAVSKTINMPREATVEDIWKAYMLAWKLGCKGITVYRYGSKEKQVLSLEEEKKEERHPRPRPSVTQGVTEKVEVGCGQTLYITVNEDQEGLCEIFSQMGKSGGCMASQSEAIGRLVSLALRSGIETSAIVKQLRGIRCPAPQWREGELILSCADAIGQAIEKYKKIKKGEVPEISLSIEKTPLISDFSPQINKREEANSKDILGRCPECPDCGIMVEFVEGCLVCPGCGYSQCS